MNFNEYQSKADNTAIYGQKIEAFVDDLQIPDRRKADHLKHILNLVYCTLGLAGEAGEIANKLKKVLRDDAGELKFSTLKELGKENGDVTWYNSQIFGILGFTFEEGVLMNLKKLSDRKENNTLTGSGDNR